MVYKCKECGGEIELQDNGLGKCLYCGAYYEKSIDNLLKNFNVSEFKNSI